MKRLDECHTYEEIAPDTYRIEELGFVNCYLLVGKKQALLIDAGCGAGYLKGCISELTHLPVILAATHRHPDHIGGAWQFGSYYASQKDCTPIYDLMCMRFISGKMVKGSGGTVTCHPSVFSHTSVKKLEEQKSFDLGGRIITFRNVPGHTRGSVVFFDEERKMMFTGDDANPYMWMQLPGCTTVQEWLNGACVIREYLRQGFTAFYGHGDGRQSEQQVDALIALGQQVIQMAKADRLPKGKHIYPSDDTIPNLYYNAKNILLH